MSLFSHDEICRYCKHVVWHKCCDTFCRCKIEVTPDFVSGLCLSKKVDVKPAKLVKNVTENWEQMEGETDEIKQLNAILTATFIGNRDFPADECLDHAQYIASLDRTTDAWKSEVVKYLRSQFAVAYRLTDTARENPRRLTSAYPVCDKAVDRVEALFEKLAGK